MTAPAAELTQAPAAPKKVAAKKPAAKKAKKPAAKKPAKKKAASKKPRWKKFVSERKGVQVVGQKLKSRMVRIDVKFADIITARANKAGQSVTEFTREWADKLK